jgi:methylmalonyl-CoA mutase
MNENRMLGSYFLDWLTDTVEEAVLEEFMKLHQRGGVLGSMESQLKTRHMIVCIKYYHSIKR